jgi:hypothetical protein
MLGKGWQIEGGHEFFASTSASSVKAR